MTTNQTNQIDPQTIINVSSELSELIYRARKIGYKNEPPRLPKKPTVSTMSGFTKRFRNWSNALVALEKERDNKQSRTIVKNPNLLETYTNK